MIHDPYQTNQEPNTEYYNTTYPSTDICNPASCDDYDFIYNFLFPNPTPPINPNYVPLPVPNPDNNRYDQKNNKKYANQEYKNQEYKKNKNFRENMAIYENLVTEVLHHIEHCKDQRKQDFENLLSQIKEIIVFTSKSVITENYDWLRGIYIRQVNFARKHNNPKLPITLTNMIWMKLNNKIVDNISVKHMIYAMIDSARMRNRCTEKLAIVQAFCNAKYFWKE